MKFLTRKNALFLIFVIFLSGFSPLTLTAENEQKGQQEVDDADMRNGEDINEMCAGCHGEYGEGGKDGEYPRIAGQPYDYIKTQMHLFRDRKRPNIPMLEYVDERQFPDGEIRDIAAYLSTVKLETRLPPLDMETFDPLERLLLAKKVLNIARFEGDFEKGEKLYKRECRVCHGDEGVGRPDKGIPMLAGQYTNYLQRQVAKYLKGIRIHDVDNPDEKFLNDFTSEELNDIFAYLSIADDD